MSTTKNAGRQSPECKFQHRLRVTALMKHPASQTHRIRRFRLRVYQLHQWFVTTGRPVFEEQGTGSPPGCVYVGAFGDWRVPLDLEPSYRWMIECGSSHLEDTLTEYQTTEKFGSPLTRAESFKVVVDAMWMENTRSDSWSEGARSYHVQVFTLRPGYRQDSKPRFECDGEADFPATCTLLSEAGRTVVLDIETHFESLIASQKTMLEFTLTESEIVTQLGRTRLQSEHFSVVIEVEYGTK